MPWTAVAGAVAGGLVNAALAPSSNTGAAASAADPFASQRGQYQQQLQAMMQPGSSFSPQDPSYAFRLKTGMDTVNAGAASSGMLNSGNRLLALENYGQGAASQEYANQFSRLSQLAGANVGSPAAAGQIINGANSGQQAGASAIGNAVGTAITGWGNSYSNSYTPQTDSGQQASGGGFNLNPAFG